MSADEELIRGCKKKNRKAQKQLFEMYSAKMMGICLRYTNSQHDAEDLLHDGFLRVFDKIKSFKGNSSIQTWMSRVFVNLAINNIRKAKKLEMSSFDEAYMGGIKDEAPTLVGYEAAEVLRCMQELPEIYKLVLNMYAIEGMSHSEIASTLNISEGGSKSRLSRARVMLKSILDSKSE